MKPRGANPQIINIIEKFDALIGLLFASNIHKEGGVYLSVYLLRKKPKKEGYEICRNPLFLLGRGERI